MREPVLPDKANEHSIFCKYASELIETVTGKALTDHASPMAMLSTLKKVSSSSKFVFIHIFIMFSFNYFQHD